MTELPRNPSEYLAQHDARIVLTVRCGLCEAEQRDAPRGKREFHKLGDVLVSSEGVEFWHTTGRRGGRWLPAVQLLKHPRLSQPDLPETLTAACKRHGVGSVATTDVLNARGTVVLTLIRPA